MADLLQPLEHSRFGDLRAFLRPFYLHMIGMVIPMFVEFSQDSRSISLINPPKYYNDWLSCLVLLITCSLYAHIQFYVYYLALISWNFVGKALIAVVALYPKTVSDAH